ncbi:MAG: DUF4832 domain-containing protein [Calditrichaeota bacterium]|nr:DUF4832 domain-containing protein [Calditrichota bacterium]
MKNILILLFINVLFLHSQTPSQSTIYYEKSDELFCNPERGFVTQRSSSLNATLIKNLRLNNITVVQKLYKIPSDFRLDSLSQNYLNTIENDFNETRKGGGKLVIRFSYTDQQSGQDAPLDIVLTHINQLAPLLQKHADVIAYMEAGFIGAWGEWYYSTNGLNNTSDRRTVLFALLDALPQKRAVAVRTPDYKRKIFQDITPISDEEAFSGTKKARTGAHNDCFLASETDYGTYVSNDIEGDKDYLNQDNRFVPQGGETCTPSAYSDCFHAMQDLPRLHWSILNRDYNQTVLSSWESDGCMEDVKRRLGYRFQLQKTVLNDSIAPGGTFNLQFDLFNEGFASPYNPRNLEIVLRDTLTKETWRIVTPEDPRWWRSGDTISVNINAGLSVDIPQGAYDVFMHLADPEEQLHNRPEYAIRLANVGLWEDSTGFNRLNHIIIIDNDAVSDPYDGELYFIKDKNSTSLKGASNSQPSRFKLIQNYPNPFNGTTKISFNLEKPSRIEFSVFNLRGEQLFYLDKGMFTSGLNSFIWNPENISSGLYLYTIDTDEAFMTGKALYIK